MSVSLNPSSQLSFHRPLTSIVKRVLTITNPNSRPVAFKVKTTAPKVYVVRPNAGRIEPNDTAEVVVMLLALKEDPPLSTKCKDKFLVQSTVITPDRETMALADVWTAGDADDETRVHQQKLKVAWLPAEGLPLTEEHEESEYPSVMTQDDSRYETIRHLPSTNGTDDLIDLHGPPMPVPHHESLDPSMIDPRAPTPPIRTVTPAANYHDTPDDHMEFPADAATSRAFVPPGVHVTPHTPPPSSPSFPVPEVERGEDPKLAEAHTEIQRLRALLASMPEPAAELRRRRASGGAVPESPPAEQNDDTRFGDQALMQDGYSPQSVAMIAFAVFLFTYLFF